MKNILKSKPVKILIIAILATIYFNIGWWYGKAHRDTQVKAFYGKSLNGFEKAILGGWQCLREKTNQGNFDTNYAMTEQVAFTFLWPVLLVVVAGSWFFYVVF